MAARERDPIGKAVAVIRWAMESNREKFGIREVARSLELTASAVHRILSSLVEEGVIQAEDGGKYQLSLQWRRLAYQAAQNMPINDLVGVHLRQLRDTTRETVVMTVYETMTQRMHTLASLSSEQLLRVEVEVSNSYPTAGAFGWCILANLLPPEQQEIIDRGIVAITDRTVTDEVRLVAQLDEVRLRGYAVTRGHQIVGAAAIATPIFRPNKRIFGAVGLSMPEMRMDAKTEERFLAEVRKCAAKVTQAVATLGSVRAR